MADSPYDILATALVHTRFADLRVVKVRPAINSCWHYLTTNFTLRVSLLAGGKLLCLLGGERDLTLYRAFNRGGALLGQPDHGWGIVARRRRSVEMSPRGWARESSIG
jgi:hypothetical protein